MANDPNAPSGTADSNTSVLPPRSLPPAAACNVGSTRGAARPSVRRLTREELRATLGDLLPANITSPVKADIDRVEELAQMDRVVDFVPVYNEAQIQQWLFVADRVGGLVAADAAARKSIAANDACFTQATVSPDCWRSVVAKFGRRAWRRPLTDDEIDSIVAAAAQKEAVEAVQGMVFRLLVAPDFMFHIESGETSETYRVRLTDHEVANRISYALTGTMPDAALAAAADAGKLRTLADVDAHARRLLDTPRGRAELGRFFDEWTEMGRVEDPLFAASGEIKYAAGSLKTDVHNFVDEILWKEKGSFPDLMSKRIAVLTDNAGNLQATYQTGGPPHSNCDPAVAGRCAPAPVQIDQTPYHGGLPLRAAFLVSSLNTSPIRRGVRVLRRFLCDDVPSPSSVVISQRDEDLAGVDPLTTPNWQRFATITAGPACSMCHARINPVGFVLERYDPIGRKRDVETAYVAAPGATGEGAPTMKVTHPLPGPVSGLNIEPGLPTTYGDPLELIDAMAKSQTVRKCLSRYYFQHIERQPETAVDQCALDDATSAIKTDQPVLETFVRAIANDDIFWRGI